jgi:hypothetical protein
MSLNFLVKILHTKTDICIYDVKTIIRLTTGPYVTKLFVDKLLICLFILCRNINI